MGTHLAKDRTGRTRGLLAAALACISFSTGRAQELLTPPVRPLNSDLAVLLDPEPRDDLPCKVSPVKPQVGFDLRFHSGYTIAIPLEELGGEGNRLRMLMRVTPLDDPEGQRYLADQFSVPPLGENPRGEAHFPGEFELGPGRYGVDWLLRDQAERVCSAHWELEAKPADWLEDDAPAIAPNAVMGRPEDPFRQAPPVRRDTADGLLHVRLLVNFSPSQPGEVTLKDWDLQAIVAILRGVAREPRFGWFSLTAFSMREEKVLFRQEDAPSLDFPALGTAVKGLNFGTVDYRRLADPLSEARFLASLLTDNTAERQRPVDAVILIGPKVTLDKNIPEQTLLSAGRPNCPVFYLNYNSDPRRNPWRDAIGAALKVYRGLEYAITVPRDLTSALADMMSRLSNPQWRQGFLPSGPPDSGK